eukprot:CAMPEP_0114659558 /NCGR_PEP_ID=MMETSP0191-20121206/18062_1 /TAXON_ID=126664 /ORGANISM="Sorites sp." /LENGTH=138 /DNA_ID=CAMNT_0001885089 /DNA_START=394 /DNA_END=810 /DNA_ORIENTATION=+
MEDGSSGSDDDHWDQLKARPRDNPGTPDTISDDEVPINDDDALYENDSNHDNDNAGVNNTDNAINNEHEIIKMIETALNNSNDTVSYLKKSGKTRAKFVKELLSHYSNVENISDKVNEIMSSFLRRMATLPESDDDDE